MTQFVIRQLPYNLSSHAGLAFIGQYVRRINLGKLVDAEFPVRTGVANSDIIRAYLGLLCLGKNDFEAVEGWRGDAFMQRALGVGSVPSSSTLRQRLDAQGSNWFELIDRINERVLALPVRGKSTDFGVLPNGYCPVDIDTFAMDNGQTRKECVGRTYAGVDGYCPLAAYLGTQGYCLQLALRPGTQHSASETEYNLEHVLPMAARLTEAPLLVRADSGFCSTALMQVVRAQARTHPIDFIIKWNPRSTPIEAWAAAKCAGPKVIWCHEREGKRSCVWQERVALGANDTSDDATIRRVYRLIERTIDRHGQPLLLPEYELEGWSTSLPERFGAAEIIALYCQHGTHEQFHSEFKSDMGLERLPSGKFDTNYLVCQMAAVAMNLLRRIGAQTLHGKGAPVRHAAQRRRLRTVMQEMMYKAARLIHHAGRWVLGLGHNDRGAGVFADHYVALGVT